MTSSDLKFRPVQYSDLEAIEALAAAAQSDRSTMGTLEQELEPVRSWYRLLKLLSFFPNPCQDDFRVYVAELGQEILGSIRVSPFNKTRTTWQVDQVLVDPNANQPELLLGRKPIGSQLLRHCLQTIWEARTWLLEVNVNEKKALSLYRENGFQPLAETTYWEICPEILAQLAQQDGDLPNLLPVNNRDAQLLYQLDTVSMPPLLRQVFDRHLEDFKTGFFRGIISKLRQWLMGINVARGYVFEPQRKAAIGYFHLEMLADGSRPHYARVTVHPAYTWLYPKLFSRMAQVVKDLPGQSLIVTSADYQPEREEYLDNLGATRIENTLLMFRSVWHKLRETKSLDLHLSQVLQQLQPVRTPIPTPISLLKSIRHPKKKTGETNNNHNRNGHSSNCHLGEGTTGQEPPETPGNGHHA